MTQVVEYSVTDANLTELAEKYAVFLMQPPMAATRLSKNACGKPPRCGQL
jgi:hypothetical protein